jgi:hypothetical protein
MQLTNIQILLPAAFTSGKNWKEKYTLRTAVQQVFYAAG